MRSSIHLRPVDPSDYGWIYNLACNPSTGTGWRLRGRTVPPEDFQNFLWNGAEVQFVACRDEPAGEPIALLSCTNVDWHGRTGYVSALAFPSLRGKGLAGQAVVAFAEHLVRVCALRKLYFETSTSSLPFAESLPERFRSVSLEGRLTDHLVTVDGNDDLLIFAIDARMIESDLEHLLPSTRDADVRAALVPVSVGFDEWVQELRRSGVDLPACVEHGADMQSELGWDSLAMLQALVVTEDRFAVGPELPPDVATIGQLHAALFR